MSTRDITHEPSQAEIEATAHLDRMRERNARLQRIHDRAVAQELVRCPADFSLLPPTSRPCADLPTKEP